MLEHLGPSNTVRTMHGCSQPPLLAVRCLTLTYFYPCALSCGFRQPLLVRCVVIRPHHVKVVATGLQSCSRATAGCWHSRQQCKWSQPAAAATGGGAGAGGSSTHAESATCMCWAQHHTSSGHIATVRGPCKGKCQQMQANASKCRHDRTFAALAVHAIIKLGLHDGVAVNCSGDHHATSLSKCLAHAG